MSDTANWPFFSSATNENRIDMIKQQADPKLNTNLNGIIGTDLTEGIGKVEIGSPQSLQNMQKTSSRVLNGDMRYHGDDEHDDFDDDDDVNSLSDDEEDSLPSPDAMYATTCHSPTGGESNGITGNRNSNRHHDDDTSDRYSKDDLSNDSHMMSDNAAVGPLAQLQHALERHSAGMLGLSMTDFNVGGAETNMFGGNAAIGQNALTSTSTGPLFNSDDITGETYRCHLCSYTGTSKYHFNAHMNTHFDHKCPFCDYTSRTEGRLKRHIRDFHSEVPPDSWAGTRVPRNSSSNDGSNNSDSGTGPNANGPTGGGKSRKYKCKQCNFIAINKQDFWEHSKTHIKAEKLLTCPKCNFVTEYKHHLEYHLRNHFGSKPFKCAKCNYSCVNKSMLNSHMKSHSNIYQYRCADCSYATKYCHSLKLHLRKYSHKPATVLNLDGTPNPYPVIDVYGTRRGPRPKKSKHSQQNNSQTPLSSKSPSSQSSPFLPPSLSPSSIVSTQSSVVPPIPSSLPMGLPFLYPPLLHGGLLAPPHFSPHIPTSLHHPMNSMSPNAMESPPSPRKAETKEKGSGGSGSNHASNRLKCNFCDFSTETRENFGKHLMLHVVSENQNANNKSYGGSQQSYPSPFGDNNNFLSFPSSEQQKALMNELILRESNPNQRKMLEQINPALNSMFNPNAPLPPNLPSNPFWYLQKENGFFNGSMFEKEEKERDELMESKLASHDRALSSAVPDEKVSSPISLPPSHPQCSLSQMMEGDATDVQKKNEVEMQNESSPLDLSSNRSTSPVHSNGPDVQEGAHVQENLVQKETLKNESPKQEPKQQSSRNRRKGKAFKLDRICLKLQEREASPVDENEDISENTNVSDQEGAAVNLEARHPLLIKAEKSRLRPHLLYNIASHLDETYSNHDANQVMANVASDNADHKSYNNVISSLLASNEALLANSESKENVRRSSVDSGTVRPDEASSDDDGTPWNDNDSAAFTCNYCDMSFRDIVMYTMHMGYHGYGNPFTCNMCGQTSKDKVAFFLHIARSPHI